MSAADNGGPAFPVPLNPGPPWQGMATRDGMSLRAYLAAHAPPVPSDFAPLSKTRVVTTAYGMKQIVPDLESQADTLVRWRLHYADMMIEALK